MHKAGVSCSGGTISLAICSEREAPTTVMILPSSVRSCLGIDAFLTAIFVWAGAVAAGPVHSHSATPPPPPEPRILMGVQFAVVPRPRGARRLLRYFLSLCGVSGASSGMRAGLVTGGRAGGAAGAGTAMGGTGSA